MNDLSSLQTAVYVAVAASICSFAGAVLWARLFIRDAKKRMVDELKRVCLGLDAEIGGIRKRVELCERQLIEHNRGMNEFGNVVSLAIPDIIMRTNRASKQINIIAETLGTVRGIGATRLGDRLYDARVAFPIQGDAPHPRAELAAEQRREKAAKKSRRKSSKPVAPPTASPKATPRYRDPITQRFVKQPTQPELPVQPVGEDTNSG